MAQHRLLGWAAGTVSEWELIGAGWRASLANGRLARPFGQLQASIFIFIFGKGATLRPGAQADGTAKRSRDVPGGTLACVCVAWRGPSGAHACRRAGFPKGDGSMLKRSQGSRERPNPIITAQFRISGNLRRESHWQRLSLGWGGEECL